MVINLIYLLQKYSTLLCKHNTRASWGHKPSQAGGGVGIEKIPKLYVFSNHQTKIVP